MSNIPSIAMIPSAYKSGKVYSVLPTDGSGDLNFARASEATRVNAQGLIETVGSNIPRLDYSDGGCPSLLLEPARTNLALSSEDFSNAVWIKNNAIVTANQIIAPDGDLTADKIVFGSGGGTPFIDNDIDTGSTIASKDFTFSLYVYSEVEFDTWLRIRGLGTTTEAENITVNIKKGWNRVSATKSFTSSADGNSLKVALFDLNLDFKTLFIWGAQLEQGSYPTSYIPTNGSIATRVAETASKSGLSSYINSQEGVLYAEIAALADDGTNRFMTLSDGTNDNRVLFGYRAVTNQIFARIEGNNSASVDLEYISSDTTLNSKVAITYDSSFNYKMYVNGLLVDSGTGTDSIIGLDRLDFANAVGTENFYGKTKQLQYFDTALTDLELEEMTGFKSFVQMANHFNYTVI